MDGDEYKIPRPHKIYGQGIGDGRGVSLSCVCVSYLKGESVLAGAEPHVLHGGAADHHLSHIAAGHKHWAAGLKEVA